MEPDVGVLMWLAAIGFTLVPLITRVLTGLWTDAYLLGSRAAQVTLGQRIGLGLGDWAPGDPAASRALLDNTPAGLQVLLAEAPRVAAGINTTRLRVFSGALSDALLSGLSVDELDSVLQAILDDQAAALTVAVTEVSRASTNAAVDRYMITEGVTHYKWTTDPRSNVCQHCRDNGTAGPLIIGHSFPHGAIPPSHVGCACALLPVM